MSRGGLLALLDLPGALCSAHASPRGAARLDVGRYPIAYVGSPETVRSVLDGRAEGISERGRFYDEVSRVIGASSLVCCAGERHRRLRRTLAPAFRPEQVGSYASTMVEATRELAEGFAAGRRIDVGATMGRLTLDIAARALLGLEHAEQVEDFVAVLQVGTRVFYRIVLPRWLSEPLWRNPLSPANRTLAAAQARVDRFVEELLAERRAAATSGRQRAPANLLDVLLDAERGSVEEPLTDRELRDQIVTFLFAGHETTAQALTWALVLLAANPPAEQKLVAEISSLPAGAPSGAGDLAVLPYCRAAVRETLRLCPPAWFLSREAERATELDGCPVPAGALVLTSPLQLHRDPAAWDEPERFLPERWLDGTPVGGEAGASGAEAGGGPAAYLPFGWGRRNCIGSSFALTEMTLVLATLLRRWKIDVRRPESVRPRPTVTLRPRHAVLADLRRR